MSNNISLVLDEKIQQLANEQKDSGEFKTYAIDREGNRFYIGASPFATAHIACVLNDVENQKTKELLAKSLNFLEKLDASDLRLYKFWYDNPFGTAFANLPYDLDDTAVVNQVLALNNRTVIDPEIIMKNTDGSGRFYTWWKPDFKYLLQKPTLFKILFNHYKAYIIFLKNKDGLKMADYEDTELTVRLNIYTLFELMDFPYSFKEKNLPYKLEEVTAMLESSLHYMNEPMYYYAVCRYHHYSAYFSQSQVEEISINLTAVINKWRTIENRTGDVFLLFLALSYLKVLDKTEKELLEGFLSENDFRGSDIMLCVGNKNFNNYHEYYAPAFTNTVLISLLNRVFS